MAGTWTFCSGSYAVPGTPGVDGANGVGLLPAWSPGVCPDTAPLASPGAPDSNVNGRWGGLIDSSTGTVTLIATSNDGGDAAEIEAAVGVPPAVNTCALTAEPPLSPVAPPTPRLLSCYDTTKPPFDSVVAS